MNLTRIKSNAANIRLLVTDVDGVLTDGGVYYGPDGELLKRFDIRDGMGVERLRSAGVETAIMTGEMSPSVQRRAEKLKITKIFLGCKDKATTLRELAQSENIPLENIAYIGDDVNDADVMKLAGLSAAPGDAFREIVELAGYICRRRGGYGAFREFAELIIEAKEQGAEKAKAIGFG